MKNLRDVERISGLVVLALVVVGCTAVLLPFISDILWAAVICYSTWPLYNRLERWLGNRPNLAAGLMTLLVMNVLVVPFAVVGYNFADSLARVVEQLNQYRNSGLPEPPDWISRIPWVGEYFIQYWTDLSENTDNMASLLKEIFMRTRGWFLQRSFELGKGLFHLTLSVVISFFFYRDGRVAATGVAETGRRILGDYSQYVLGVVGTTIKSVVYGLIGTALAQGFVAWVGFYIAGLPSALLLGLLTFMLALIPGGPPLIWVPATIWLFVEGQVGWGIFMGLWGLLGISAVDNIVRPLLISRGTPLPFVLILLGVMGGLLVFGFMGLFLGPTLLAVGYCLIQEFTRKKRSGLAVPGGDDSSPDEEFGS